ncbi:hypothetical protein A7985_25055 [Pseudoalteromonas luteoviolacea]|uniref:Cyclic GMP-AMP synthase n=1 Tax=Pseudoalteromonas luteoviolacea TaxID=43657 RepID=A0A1C0TIV4_9GAMM|nr:nucleotidyltransferase [Pseudoalteromonas luteoviolacea]OCQ17948.1 hypothetical protein A7985_25055 [Pseudoalteromonas luteoviolacea]
MRNNENLLQELADNLDLPDGAYKQAIDRYQSLGKWFGRDESSVKDNDPHIFPQGSFRLGIAIKPLSGEEEYDLDLACSLRSGITPMSHSQNDLKDIVGNELEDYRKAKGISEELESKHRCWRLEYQDNLKFHMDIVPCIPENEVKMKSLAKAMASRGLAESFSKEVADNAVGITDDRLENFDGKPSEWMISNPEGYARWFESRMVENFQIKAACEALQVDDVPVYNTKTPLQRAVQVLKRHRDTMFKENPDSKPISVIITTLSATYYDGSSSLESAFLSVLKGLKEFSDSDSDVVLNPVNPEENFADRWSMPNYKHLELKKNFHLWVDQVVRDFEYLFTSDNLVMISESVLKSLSVSIEQKQLVSILGLSLAATKVTAQPKAVNEPVSKPWHRS